MKLLQIVERYLPEELEKTIRSGYSRSEIFGLNGNEGLFQNNQFKVHTEECLIEDEEHEILSVFVFDSNSPIYIGDVSQRFMKIIENYKRQSKFYSEIAYIRIVVKGKWVNIYLQDNMKRHQ